MQDDKNARTLTPHEEVRAKENAYAAFKREMEMRNPRPEPSASDYVHENPRVINALKFIISVLPAILGVVGMAAIFISADKTFSAFELGVNSEWRAIKSALGVCGVIMTEFGLVYVEFAAVRERLKKRLPRTRFTLKSIKRQIEVLKGNVPPLDYSEMPDSALGNYSRLIFAVVLSANIYGAYAATQDNSDEIGTIFAFVLGIAGAFSLRFIGAQLAHLTYEIMEQERLKIERNLNAKWQDEMDKRWEQVEYELVRRSMHRAYIIKNDLALDASSPYILQAGEDGNLEPVPFEPMTLPTLLPSDSDRS